jgi:hypothetical protein
VALSNSASPANVDKSHIVDLGVINDADTTSSIVRTSVTGTSGLISATIRRSGTATSFSFRLVLTTTVICGRTFCA